MSPSELGEVEGTTKPSSQLLVIVVADTLFHAISDHTWRPGQMVQIAVYRCLDVYGRSVCG